MPSRDYDSPRRKSRLDEGSPRTSRVGTEQEQDKPKKHRRRQSSPEHITAADRVRDSTGAARLARASIASIPRSSKGAVEDVPEMTRRPSAGDTNSYAYPAFSKEHSREAVRPAEEARKSKVSIVDPRPEEISRTEGLRPSPRPTRPKSSSSRAPPSPPLTADEADRRRPSSGQSGRRSHEDVNRPGPRGGPEAGLGTRSSRLAADNTSPVRRSSPANDSDSSLRTTGPTAPATKSTPGTRLPSPNKDGGRISAENMDIPARDGHSSTPGTSNARRPTDQDATPTQSTIPRPASANQSVPFRSFSSPTAQTRADPPLWQPSADPGYVPTWQQPPPFVSYDVEDPPRVDYLLHNGGLPNVIPRSLIPRPKATKPQPNPNMAEQSTMPVFSIIQSRLDDFNKVLTKNGSVAVATGYRSVARKLLDRLEHVFARNISSEKCFCVICKTSSKLTLSSEEEVGVSWGEILEFVSGRRELPRWPPFTFDANTDVGLNGKIKAPMQKLDPDVPDEYRQHYLRQNDKTKRTVQSWLESQTDDTTQTEMPGDVDDETLSFAMLTRLDRQQQALYTSLIKGPVPASDAGAISGGAQPSENPVLEKTSLALQRLYRLNSRPRRPECTLYLLNNIPLHGILATLAAVSPAEWDILVSGRFDGFLWSGAEACASPTYPPPRGSTPMPSNLVSPSRAGIPNIPRFATPLSASGFSSASPAATPPVQHDEETEIAALAELERNIFADMERLENDFEAVHQAAEDLRARLRARAAGLTSASRARKGDGVGQALPPAPGRADDVFDDGRSELAPDDSASNISFVRRRRREGERRGLGYDDGERRSRR